MLHAVGQHAYDIFVLLQHLLVIETKHSREDPKHLELYQRIYLLNQEEVEVNSDAVDIVAD